MQQEDKKKRKREEESESDSDDDSDDDSGPRRKPPPGKKASMPFDPETGALTRTFKSFASKTVGVDDGYGKTKGLSKHPFLRPQIMLVVAPTGGGKTTLALNILEEVLDNINEKRLGKVMFYTGSPQDELLKVLDPDDVDVYGPENTASLLTDLRALQIEGMGIGGSAPAGGGGGGSAQKSRKQLHILILDDAGNNRDLTPNNAKGSDIGQILISHRHIPMMVIFLVQKYNLLPTFARSNASQLFLFPGKSQGEMKEIFNTLPMPRERLEETMRLIANEDHQFLWIDLINRTAKMGFDRTVLE